MMPPGHRSLNWPGLPTAEVRLTASCELSNAKTGRPKWPRRKEAHKARELREALGICRDQQIAAVESSQGNLSGSQAGKAPPRTEIWCWNCIADGHRACDCPMLCTRIQQLVKNASKKTATCDVRSHREGGTQPVVAVAAPLAEEADTSSLDSSSSPTPLDFDA